MRVTVLFFSEADQVVSEKHFTVSGNSSGWQGVLVDSSFTQRNETLVVRENAAVEGYFNDASEAIFRLIQIAHDDVPGMPLSLCGELAGRPEHTARLLGCGIESFSVAPPLIPAIKEAIRSFRCKQAPQLKATRSAILGTVSNTGWNEG